MSNSPFYRLVIYRSSGDAFQVLGSEDVLQAAVTEWQDKTSACDDNNLLTVHGISDSADRASVQITIRLNAIEGMVLTKWF